MTDVWSERAEQYRTSDAHREGPDLDLLVEWAAGARTALDVATGGGHVARRLREAGIEVVSCDPAPGMQPDVVCRAEHLPFADDSFDVVATRVAAHHFDDVAQAVAEMARVAAGTRVDRRQPLHGGRGRGGREASRSLARAQLQRGRMARVRRARRGSRSVRCASSRSRSSCSPGSTAAVVRATTPSGFGSCSATASAAPS